jgi:hypothetical protein
MNAFKLFYVVLLATYFLLRLLFDPEDAGSAFLRNVAGFIPDYTALHPKG